MIALPSVFSKQEALIKLARNFSHLLGTYLLLSGGEQDSSEISFLCLCPFETLSVSSDGAKRICTDGEVVEITTCGWEALAALMGQDRTGSPLPEWVGYLAYEMGQQGHCLPFPEALFYRHAVVLLADHKKEKATLYLEDSQLFALTGEMAEIAKPEYWHSLEMPKEKSHFHSSFEEKLPFESLEEYCKKVSFIQEDIRSGDVYQVNLSHRSIIEGEFDPYQIFEHLYKINPAPFSAFANVDWGTIISSSPERLLKRDGQKLEARPIKGTIARGKTDLQDQLQIEQLLSSEKELAELLMITDLMRNDLARISKVGTVEVEELIRCEKYTNVFHLLSIVRSQGLDGLSAVDAVRACFPGGSITGCPKVAAQKTIKKLENRFRGIYTGSIGYFCGNGDFDFNIAIRTLVYRNQELEISLGGGVTIDSVPEEEYWETVVKGDSIMKVIRALN